MYDVCRLKIFQKANATKKQLSKDNLCSFKFSNRLWALENLPRIPNTYIR